MLMKTVKNEDMCRKLLLQLTLVGYMSHDLQDRRLPDSGGIFLYLHRTDHGFRTVMFHTCLYMFQSVHYM